MLLPCYFRVVHVLVQQGAPLIALQECGPRGAATVCEALGTQWQYFSGSTEDPVATFWDTRVASYSNMIHATRYVP